MARFYIRPAEQADNEVLCKLSEVAIEGQISLALERYPDFFAGAAVQNQLSNVQLICDRAHDDRVAAVFGIGQRREFVSGKPSWIRYLSDVRIMPQYRGNRPLRMINNHIVNLETTDPSTTTQSVFFSDNHVMRDVVRRPAKLLRRLKYLWFYECGTYRTSAVSLTAGERRHAQQYRVRRATRDDIPTMQDFFDHEAPGKQLYPAYRFDELHDPYYRGLSIENYFLACDDTGIIGITGTWDQRSFKQTRIAGYSGVLRYTRPVVNLASRLVTGFSLPPAGTELRYFYLHSIVTRDNSTDIFRDLVEHIYDVHRGGKHEYFLCGLFSHDPLTEVLDSFRARRDMSAQHYEVGIDELQHPLSPNAPMYVEAARL